MTAPDHGWRPIEEAPHATDVLLFVPATSHTPAKQEVGWASGGQRYPNGVSNRWWHGSATHWQPLPPPPAQEPAADG